MKGIYRFLVCFASVVLVVACMRDDDEPVRPGKPISRLYVSTLEQKVNTTDDTYDNIFVIDPADSNEFGGGNRIDGYGSGIKGGAGLFYSPDLKMLFQASQNNPSFPDTAVQGLEVSPQNGVLKYQSKMESDMLTSVRGIAYHRGSDVFMLVNSGANPHIYAYMRPRAIINPRRPDLIIPVPNQAVYSMFIHDISITENDRRNTTYISTTGQDGKILGYQNLPQRIQLNALTTIRDTVRINVSPDFILTVPGTQNLVGMSYSPLLDLLVATDFNNGVGRVLFFEDFSTHTTTKSLTPSRVLTGTSTLLKNPVDIEIDKRDGAVYFYVADTQEKAVLRFSITDEGNTAPNAVLKIMNGQRTPVGIALDARGALTEEE